MGNSFSQNQSIESNNNNEDNMKIDINKANSKEVRGIVRKILKNKFGMFINLITLLLLI